MRILIYSHILTWNRRSPYATALPRWIPETKAIVHRPLRNESLLLVVHVLHCSRQVLRPIQIRLRHDCSGGRSGHPGPRRGLRALTHFPCFDLRVEILSSDGSVITLDSKSIRIGLEISVVTTGVGVGEWKAGGAPVWFCV